MDLPYCDCCARIFRVFKFFYQRIISIFLYDYHTTIVCKFYAFISILIENFNVSIIELRILGRMCLLYLCICKICDFICLYDGNYNVWYCF